MRHDCELRIVIPAANEAHRIAPTLQEYCEYFSKRAHIVVVSNGSSDRTADIVLELQKRFENLSLLAIPAKIGKGGAVRVGFSAGAEEFVGFTDADGSTSAREFDRLLGALKNENLNGVIGSRWKGGAKLLSPQPLMRRIASRVFNLLVRVLFGLPFRDTQCGAKVFRRRSLDPVLPALQLSNFAFDVDLLYRLHQAGAKILELPISWSEAPSGSTVRLASASLSMFVAIVGLRLRDSIASAIPFLDYVGRQHFIPVRKRVRVLIVSGSNVEGGPVALVSTLQLAGHDVRWVRTATIVGRARFFIWYSMFGRREVHAVVEVASPIPYCIAPFSVKPTLLIGAQRTRGIARFIYGNFYKRAQRVASFQEVEAESVINAVMSDDAYAAVLDQRDEAWTLNFRDMATGAARQERL